MVSVFGQVLLQALYYGLVMILTIVFIALLMRGFFMNYVKVRTSFGRLVMIKVRSRLRDYFKRGWVEDGYLCYERKNGFMDVSTVRIRIPSDEKVFYRCLSVLWVDIDEEKNVLCGTDYEAVDGYDAIKFDNLLKRALTRPNINTGIEKLMVFLLIIIVIMAVIGALMGYLSMAKIQKLTEAMPGMLKSMAGTVVGGGRV